MKQGPKKEKKKKKKDEKKSNREGEGVQSEKRIKTDDNAIAFDAGGKLKLEQCQNQNRLEAVEGALLLFLVKSEHALFELSARGLGFTAGTALLFDGLQG